MVQTRSQTAAIVCEKEFELAQANTARIEKELEEATRDVSRVSPARLSELQQLSRHYVAELEKLLADAEKRLAAARLLAKQKETNPVVSSMGEASGKDTSLEGPPILGPDDPAAGKPPCYLGWGRFMTQAEYRKSSGKTFEEVTQMMFPKTHPQGWSKEHHYMAMGGQCGQSCGCCRAEVYNSGVDPDAKFGACDMCLK